MLKLLCYFNISSHNYLNVPAYFSTVVFMLNNIYWRAKFPRSIHIASVRYCHLLSFHTTVKTAKCRSLKIRKLISARLALILKAGTTASREIVWNVRAIINVAHCKQMLFLLLNDICINAMVMYMGPQYYWINYLSA